MCLCVYLQGDSDNEDETVKKHYQCPAEVRVAHLKKLIRWKYGLDPKHKVSYNNNIIIFYLSLPISPAIMVVGKGFWNIYKLSGRLLKV